MLPDLEDLLLYVIGAMSLVLGLLIGWTLAEMMCAAIDAWELIL